MKNDTIYALATPPGVSGVAVIRISGSESFRVLTSISKKETQPRSASLRHLFDPRSGSLIDEALVIFFPGPASFTGEDVVELQVHGSLAVIDLLSDVLSYLGCRPANRGEFSRRAMDEGKIDLISAEALDDLIQAEDPAALALAHGQAGVRRQKRFDHWRITLTRLQAACEALIDFPDDDLPRDLIEKNHASLSEILKDVQELETRSDLAKVLEKGLDILLVGPPNAGKSTLLNALAGYDRAIVSEEPGTTRDFVELEMNLGPYRVRFVDTAGLRETDVGIENIGIQRTRDRFSSAALILNLHDPFQIPEQIDSDSPVWVVQTKGHIPGRRSLAAADQNKAGLDLLLRDIENWLDEKFGSVFDQLSFYRERQVFHVKQMARALEAATKVHILPEMQAEHLRQASDALGRLSGTIHIEDVLDELFNGFCIGK